MRYADTPELQAAIDAIRAIKTQADLNVLADVWKQQMTFIGRQASSGLAKGDTITCNMAALLSKVSLQK